MLKIALLDQLMIEYLMSVQQQLLDETTKLEQAHAVAQGERQYQEKALEQNRIGIDQGREELQKKSDQVAQLKLYRQQLTAFKCSYCPKLFKNLHYLEKHMVKHEAINLKLEREKDIILEKQRREDEERKRIQIEIEKSKMAIKQEEMDKLKSDVEQLRRQLDDEHADKTNMERRMKKVNDDLSNNLRKVEDDLAVQVKSLETIKNTKPQIQVVYEKSPSHIPVRQYPDQAGPGSSDLPTDRGVEKSEIVQPKSPMSQPISDNGMPSVANTIPLPLMVDGMKTVTQVDFNPDSRQPPVQVATPKDQTPLNSQTQTPQPDLPSLDTMMDLISRSVVQSKPKGFILAPSLAYNPQAGERPNQELLNTVVATLQAKGINPYNPVGTREGQASSADLVSAITGVLMTQQMLIQDPNFKSESRGATPKLNPQSTNNSGFSAAAGIQVPQPATTPANSSNNGLAMPNLPLVTDQTPPFPYPPVLQGDAFKSQLTDSPHFVAPKTPEVNPQEEIDRIIIMKAEEARREAELQQIGQGEWLTVPSIRKIQQSSFMSSKQDLDELLKKRGDIILTERDKQDSYTVYEKVNRTKQIYSLEQAKLDQMPAKELLGILVNIKASNNQAYSFDENLLQKNNIYYPKYKEPLELFQKSSVKDGNFFEDVEANAAISSAFTNLISREITSTDAKLKKNKEDARNILTNTGLFLQANDQAKKRQEAVAATNPNKEMASRPERSNPSQNQANVPLSTQNTQSKPPTSQPVTKPPLAPSPNMSDQPVVYKEDVIVDKNKNVSIGQSQQSLYTGGPIPLLLNTPTPSNTNNQSTSQAAGQNQTSQSSSIGAAAGVKEMSGFGPPTFQQPPITATQPLTNLGSFVGQGEPGQQPRTGTSPAQKTSANYSTPTNMMNSNPFYNQSKPIYEEDEDPLSSLTGGFSSQNPFGKSPIPLDNAASYKQNTRVNENIGSVKKTDDDFDEF